MANRLLKANLNAITSLLTTLSASAQQTTNPLSHWLDQLRQKTARSPVGWTITEDNRRIDVNRTGPGNFTATIALGYYATGALLAAAIQAALIAADGGNAYTCVYSTSTFKFTIAGTSNFTLRWLNGGNAYRSVGICAGFDVVADDTGTNTYTGDWAVYQSRWFIRATAAAGITATAVAFLQHNLLSGIGKITVQAHTADDWSAPTLVTTLSAITADPSYAYFASQTKVWWRFTIDNTRETSGLTEIGSAFLGTYVEPTYCHSVDLSYQAEPFTTAKDSISGSRFVNNQPDRGRWAVGWATQPPAEQLVLDQFFVDIPFGTSFFFDFDPATAGQLFYVSREAFGWNFVPYQYRDYATQLVESL